MRWRLPAVVCLAFALAGVLLLPNRAAAALTLAEAVDQLGLAWSTALDTPWLPQTLVTHDGAHAARSGALGSTSGVSWIETTVTRPGTLRWWWYAEPCIFDRLDFTVDGQDRRYWSDLDTAWRQDAIYLDGSAASSTVRWVYSRSGSCSSPGTSLEAGLLDQVEYLPGSAEYFTVPTVAGPEAAGLDRAATYTSYSATASNEVGVEYLFEWDDIPEPAWGSGTRSHTWGSAGTHRLRVRARCPHAALSDWSPYYTVQVYDIPLAGALEAPGQTWTTGGDALWFGEGLVAHDGTDAAQTEPLASSQSAWVETTVTGPGVVSFWWKVSSEEFADYCSLLVDGVLFDRISGEVGWEGGVEQTYDLGPGTHALRWVYAKDGSEAEGADRAWLDQFSFTPETITTPSVSGPGFAIAGVPDGYGASGAANSSGHALAYEFSYDGVPTGNWDLATQAHDFAVGGTHEVRVRARCIAHPETQSGWSEPLAVTVEGISPPAKPGGATQAWVGFHAYDAAGASSSAGHALEYQFSFDGAETLWLDAPGSGVSWAAAGTRQVLVRARCKEHTAAVSAWSPPLAVAVLSSFKDTFTDGTARGDRHWTVLSGTFAAVASAQDPTRGRRLVSSPAGTSLALLKPVDSFSTGRIAALVKLVEYPGTVPMAEVLFQVRQHGAPAYWRYVRITKDRIVLGEAGDIHGDGKTGVLATRLRRFLPGRWYRLRVDIRADRRIQVRIDKETVPALSTTVPMSFYSRVGVRSRRARAMWDDFLVQDNSLTPPP